MTGVTILMCREGTISRTVDCSVNGVLSCSRSAPVLGISALKLQSLCIDINDN